jgi:hypothetical protein
MNQCEKIKDYINRFGSISTMDAFKDLGITRLAARIMEIEHQGIKIARKNEYSVNRFGDKVHYTVYSFEKEMA